MIYYIIVLQLYQGAIEECNFDTNGAPYWQGSRVMIQPVPQLYQGDESNFDTNGTPYCQVCL